MSGTLLGTTIGHFRFIDKIATGGMGEIYVGYDEALERKVVLKGIRPEFQLDRDAKARFLREARVLSQLGHPNICQVYDYLEGETSDFIVMELVEGVGLNKAMKKGLDEKTKMQIAEQIASVLVSAHEKGVIHRDLKPENVMLTAGNQVKVLDFGLSRKVSEEITLPLLESEPDQNKGSLSPTSTTDSLGNLTRAGAVMGTLSYMSPEQARGEAATAASDMYSFGLILQELFTGKPCYEEGLSVEKQLEKARKGETLPVIGIDADLKTLIERLKSLQPSARPSALDTAEKLKWIRNKPIRRRKRLLVVSAIIVLSFLSIAMTIETIRATKAEKRAKTEAETSRQILDFLVNIFKISDPSEAKGKTITARELLDASARKIETELQNQPLVQATLMETMGNTYIGLGLYEEALPLLQNSLKIREKLLKPDNLLIADSLRSLGLLYSYQGKYSEAEPLLKRSLEIRENRLGPEHPDVADSLCKLANVYYYRGKHSEAESLYKHALLIQEKILGPYHPAVAMTLTDLGVLYGAQGKLSEIEPLYQRALKIEEKSLGPEHPDLAKLLNNLAAYYHGQGRLSEAESLYKRCLEIREKNLGPDHPKVATVLFNLASLYTKQGRYSEAEPLFRRALQIDEKYLGSNHPYIAEDLEGYAELLRKTNRIAEAEKCEKRAKEIKDREKVH